MYKSLSVQCANARVNVCIDSVQPGDRPDGHGGVPAGRGARGARESGGRAEQWAREGVARAGRADGARAAAGEDRRPGALRAAQAAALLHAHQPRPPRGHLPYRRHATRDTIHGRCVLCLSNLWC